MHDLRTLDSVVVDCWHKINLHLDVVYAGTLSCICMEGPVLLG